MEHSSLRIASAVPSVGGLQVVICGSFHREREALAETYDRFVGAGTTVLSPLDLDFVEDRNGFLLAAEEIDQKPAEIEERHLGAMRDADFVWLHAPEGYVGSSAAMELGFAHGLGLAVYASTIPTDLALRDIVRFIASPEDAVAASSPDRLATDAPTGGFRALQQYYKRAAQRRGWADESAAETVQLLSGEVRELMEALQATNGLAEAVGDEDPTLELADVALYVVHLANVLGLDLGDSISAKERINAARFPNRVPQPA